VIACIQYAQPVLGGKLIDGRQHFPVLGSISRFEQVDQHIAPGCYFSARHRDFLVAAAAQRGQFVLVVKDHACSQRSSEPAPPKPGSKPIMSPAPGKFNRCVE